MATSTIENIGGQIALLKQTKTVNIAVEEVTGSYKDISATVNDSTFNIVKGFNSEGSSGIAIMSVYFSGNTVVRVRIRNVSGGTIATGATVTVYYA